MKELQNLSLELQDMTALATLLWQISYGQQPHAHPAAPSHPPPP